MKKVFAAILIAAFSLLMVSGVDALSDKQREVIRAPWTFAQPIVIKEQPVVPGTPMANFPLLYSRDDGAGVELLYFLSSDGTETDLIAAAGAVAYNAISDPTAAGSISFDATETATYTSVATAVDFFNIVDTAAFGDVSIVVIEQNTGNPTDGTLLELKLAAAETDPDYMSAAIGGVEEFNIAAGGAVTSISTLTATGFVGYGAGANAASTFDAKGSGTMTFGATSTGDAIFSRDVQLDEGVDLGDASGDAIALVGTLTSVTDSTWDDGTTHSPSITFQDQTNETATLQKLDSADFIITTVAADGARIVTGNLRVGNAVPGVAAMDGEDFYVEGESEFDGAMQVDGLLTAAGGITMAGATFTLGAAEEVLINASTTPHTDTVGALDLNLTTATDAVSAMDIFVNATVIVDQDTTYGIKLDLDTDANPAGGATTNFIEGIHVAASDSTEAGGTTEFRGLVTDATIDYGTHHTLGAGFVAMLVDGDTTAHTGTAGLLDIGMTSLTNTASAMDVQVTTTHSAATTQIGTKYDLLTDATAGSGFLEAININASDSTEVGGTTQFRGLALENTLDYGVYAAVGAGFVGIFVDGDTAAHTGTAGLLDIGLTSLTANASAMDIKVTSTATAANTQVGIALDLDTDANHATTNYIEGIQINATDVTEAGGTTVIRGIAFENTLDQSEYHLLGAGQEAMVIDGGTTAHTGTNGLIDIALGTATTTASAMDIQITTANTTDLDTTIGVKFDLLTNSNAAGGSTTDYIEAININASDVTEVGGTTVMRGVFAENTLDESFYALCGVSQKALVVDANTADSTETDGVIDVTVGTATTLVEGVNILMQQNAAGGAIENAAVYIELDGDGDGATDDLIGIHVEATDTTCTGEVIGINVNATDATSFTYALYAEQGDIGVAAGVVEVDTAVDEDSYVERAQATVTGPVFSVVEQTDTVLSAQAAFLVDQDSTAATSAAVRIDTEGANALEFNDLVAAGDGLVVTTATGYVGKVISIVPGLAADIVGAAGEGAVEIHNVANQVQNSSLLRLDSDTGTLGGQTIGYMLEIDDDSGASAGSYCVEINSLSNEGLAVTLGKSQFVESVQLGGTSNYTHPLIFEGTTNDTSETALRVEDPTADRVITLPDYAGGVPLVIYQSSVQFSHSEATTVDVTGFTLTPAANWFSAGKTLRYTVAGTKTGANDVMHVALWIEDLAVVTLDSDAATAGDWKCEFIVHAVGLANQDVVGECTFAAAANVPEIDFNVDTTDFSVGTDDITVQVGLTNATDVITAEYMMIETWTQ